MKMDVIIREYEACDYASCRSLWEELTERHRELYADPTIGGEDPGKGIDAHLSDTSVRGTWVATLKGQVVGFASLHVRGSEGEVDPIAVHSEYRRRGIGTALMSRAIEVAKSAGVRYLSVRPVARNVEAIEFYVRAGFNIVGHVDLFQDLSPPSRTEWTPGIVLHGHELRY